MPDCGPLGSDEGRGTGPAAAPRPDPVAHPEGELTDDSGIIHMTDGRMIQPAQRFRFTQEPGTNRRIGVEVHPQADSSLEELIVGLEQHLFGRDGHGALQAIATPQGLLGALEIPKRLA